MAQAKLKNCKPTCRHVKEHCPDAQLNTCQPLTFPSKFQLTEAAIHKQMVSGNESGNKHLFTMVKMTPKVMLPKKKIYCNH